MMQYMIHFKCLKDKTIIKTHSTIERERRTMKKENNEVKNEVKNNEVKNEVKKTEREVIESKFQKVKTILDKNNVTYKIAKNNDGFIIKYDDSNKTKYYLYMQKNANKIDSNNKLNITKTLAKTIYEKQKSNNRVSYHYHNISDENIEKIILKLESR